MKLTSDAVEELTKECQGEDLPVDGLVHRFLFDKAKIEQNKPKIMELLADLPDNFRTTGGGGWSFLNGCQDRNGDQWTGLHLQVEKLVCLGIAAGAADWLMKELAPAMPGGMPYFCVRV